MSSGKKIAVKFILEMVGRPKEHLVESLTKIIDELNEEKGIEVIEKKINEPIPMENQEGFFNTFAEIEFEVDEIIKIASLMFKYMPANVEVIEPEILAISNNGWTEIMNELTRRLHGYDEIARVLQMQNAQMQKKLNELAPKETEKKE